MQEGRLGKRVGAPPEKLGAPREEAPEEELCALMEELDVLQEELQDAPQDKEKALRQKVCDLWDGFWATLEEKVAVLELEVSALRDAPQGKGGPLQRKVKALERALHSFAEQKGDSLEDRMLDLRRAQWKYMRKALCTDSLEEGDIQQKVDALKDSVWDFLLIGPPQMELDALKEKMDALKEEGAVRCRSPKAAKALLKNVDSLLKHMEALQKTVDAKQEKMETLQEKLDSLRDVPQKVVGGLREKLDALQHVLQDIPQRKLDVLPKKLNALQENVKAVRIALRNFLRDAPGPEKLDSLEEKVGLLRDISLDEVGALQGKVDALQEKVGAALGVSLKEMYALEGKRIVLCNALWNSSLKDALQEKEKAMQEKLDALWHEPEEEVGDLWEELDALQDVLQSIPLRKLTVLQEKLDTLQDSLLHDQKKKLNALQEKLNAIREAPQGKLGILQQELHVPVCDELDDLQERDNLQEKLDDPPQKIPDPLQAAQQEGNKLVERDEIQFSEMWKDPGTDELVSTTDVPIRGMLFSQGRATLATTQKTNLSSSEPATSMSMDRQISKPTNPDGLSRSKGQETHQLEEAMCTESFENPVASCPQNAAKRGGSEPPHKNRK